MSGAAAFLLAALVAYAAAGLLARAAPALGWLDAPSEPRKTQARAVPPVGGAAVLAGLAAALALAGWSPPCGLARAPALATLGLAFAVGTLDDRVRGGLTPGAKLALQLASALPLAAAAARRWPEQPVWAALLALLAVAAAANLANTFDHADGALGALALLGLALAPSPAAAGAVAGFLPRNLDAGRPAGASPDARAAPSAYLGDAGSHLLGVLLLLTPPAWPVLVLPALDLARLARARLAAGSRPWIGDRRHIGHLLARGGRSPRRVAALLALGAAPAQLGLLVPAPPAARLALVLALGLAGYAGLLRAARARP